MANLYCLDVGYYKMKTLRLLYGCLRHGSLVCPIEHHLLESLIKIELFKMLYKYYFQMLTIGGACGI